VLAALSSAVAEHIKAQRSDVLKALSLREDLELGLEGWLKIELLPASSTVENVRIIRITNKGVDVHLDIDGRQLGLELKGNARRDEVGDIVAGATRPDAHACLFLQRASKNFETKLQATGLMFNLDRLDKNFVIGLAHETL
jgi:hypothetical protein